MAAPPPPSDHHAVKWVDPNALGELDGYGRPIAPSGSFIAEPAACAQVAPPPQLAQYVTALDVASWSRLAAVQRIRMKQGRALLEAVTGGVMPSKYIFADFNRMYQPHREGQPWGAPQPYPLFIVEEQSKCDSCCDCNKDCMCRICCSPRHPMLLDFFVAGPPEDPGPCKCICITCWEREDHSHKMGDPFMQLERFGCCQRWANCWVCSEQCQDEMRLHYGKVGDVRNGDEAGCLPDDRCVSIAKVPIGGGGCTPTIEITQKGDGTAIGVVEGPTCFGGCYDLCCDTHFTVSKVAGGAGDLAKITKIKPSGCSEWCKACCSTADTYHLDIVGDGQALVPEQKAMLIGEMVHLDAMFFENDKFPIECEKQGDTTYITILLCLCYCYGCLCPIKCVIPLQESN